MQLDANTCYVFSDGSGSARDRTGGWGCVLYFNGHTKIAAGGGADTTSNAMELTAAVKGLQLVRKVSAPVTLVTDSKYVLTCLRMGMQWELQHWINGSGLPCANVELVKLLLIERRRLINLRGQWVPGHNGIPLNEAADALAGYGRSVFGLRAVHGSDTDEYLRKVLGRTLYERAGEHFSALRAS